MQPKSLLIVAMLCAGCSCSMHSRYDIKPALVDGDVHEGQLSIFSGGRGGASLVGKDGVCHDLALPPSVVENAERWDGKMVVLVGESVARPSDPAAIYYKIFDREIEAGGCGNQTIYVRKITKK